MQRFGVLHVVNALLTGTLFFVFFYMTEVTFVVTRCDRSASGNNDISVDSNNGNGQPKTITVIVDGRSTALSSNGRSPLFAAFESISQTAHLLKGCRHVYLDVGANVGVQVRKLFEPELYPGSPAIAYYSQYFGNISYIKQHVCAFGFEANPVHFPRLRAIEQCYTKRGWPTVFFGPVAVSRGQQCYLSTR